MYIWWHNCICIYTYNMHGIINDGGWAIKRNEKRWNQDSNLDPKSFQAKLLNLEFSLDGYYCKFSKQLPWQKYGWWFSRAPKTKNKVKKVVYKALKIGTTKEGRARLCTGGSRDARWQRHVTMSVNQVWWSHSHWPLGIVSWRVLTTDSSSFNYLKLNE